MNHTPGPWSWNKNNWRGEEDLYYAYVAGDRYENEDGTQVSTGICRVEGNATSQRTTEANARLISAAPDLLAACERIAEFIDFPRSCNCDRCEAGRAIISAIAKAKREPNNAPTNQA